MDKYQVFQRFQKSILAVANNSFGRKYLGIAHEVPKDKRIVMASPNGYAFATGRDVKISGVWQPELTARFRCYDLLGKRLELGLKVATISPFIATNPQFAPVMFGITTSFFAGAGDGDVANRNVASFSACRGATTGTTLNQGGDVRTLEFTIFSGNYYIGRAFYPTDTTALTSSAVITAATLNVYGGTASTNADSQSIGLTANTQADPATLATTDFNDITLDSPTEGATHKTYASWTNSAYNAFALNATGLTFISKTGYTKIGLRATGDINNGVPTVGENYIHASSSATAGTSNDPYLEVVYTLPSGAGFFFMSL